MASLKAVKRVMYGRASLDLLKRKMVFSDLCFNKIVEKPNKGRKEMAAP